MFLGKRYAIPEMRKPGGSSIINSSSQLGLVGMKASNRQYQACKGAVSLLTKLVAIQYVSNGIRLHSVQRGSIVTPMTEARHSDPEVQQLMIS